MAEQIASRTTENDTTLVLKRQDNTRFKGAQYEYYVTESGSDAPIDRYASTKQEGMNQLRSTVKDYERATQRNQSSGMGFVGFGGGIPGLGMDNKDDDDPQFPWL